MIAAFGKNRKIDNEFFRLVQEKLKSFLKSYGENLIEFESMPVEIQEVDFEGWAADQADFLKKSLHGDTEFAIAFFPSQDTQVKLGESASSKMLALEIDEIRADNKVDFDAYIYMPTNNRYLCMRELRGFSITTKPKDLRPMGLNPYMSEKKTLVR